MRKPKLLHIDESLINALSKIMQNPEEESNSLGQSSAWDQAESRYVCECGLEVFSIVFCLVCITLAFVVLDISAKLDKDRKLVLFNMKTSTVKLRPASVSAEKTINKKMTAINKTNICSRGTLKLNQRLANLEIIKEI